MDPYFEMYGTPTPTNVHFELYQALLLCVTRDKLRDACVHVTCVRTRLRVYVYKTGPGHEYRERRRGQVHKHAAGSTGTFLTCRRH